MKLEKGKDPEFNNFEIVSLRILTRLTFHEDIDEEIIDLLREMELEYYSLLKKYEITEERINIDDKTTLLKFNENFLVNIVKAIGRYWQSSQKSHLAPISYLRMDLDDFSKINNRYGHDMGDKILVAVAQVLKRYSRPTDYLFRFGGEEFDIVLPVTNLKGAEAYVKKVMKGIRDISIMSETGENVTITASVGISHFMMNFKKNLNMIQDKIISYYRIVQREADYACYNSKYCGKDRYSFYDPEIDYKKIMIEYSSR
jgi:diguanylate cyclase (GGDEF)-like protein